MKKIFSLPKTLAAAALTLLTVTSCGDSYEYMPDNETAGKVGQVYFEQTLPSTIELGIEDSEFEVTLQRANTDGEITVKLNTTQSEPAIYNVPENITFADGAAEATLKITVNPDDLVYEDMREITISIEDTYATPYGINSYTVNVGVPAPWTPWCNNAADFEAAGGSAEWPLGEVGTGTYTFTQMLSGTMSGVKVEFRQHKLNGDCQFRFVDLATSYFPKWTELVMDAKWMEESEVYMLRLPKTFTGYFASNYPGDELFIADQLSYAELQGSEVPWDKWEELKAEMKSWYNPATGMFNLSVYYAISLGYFGQGVETCQMDGFYVPDYSVSAVYQGIFTGADGKVSVVGNATLGKDATDVRAIVMPQDMDIQEIVDAMIAEESSESLPWVAVAESGNFSVPFDPKAMGTEKLQIAMIAVVEGEAKTVNKVAFEYSAGENPWKSLGKGLFTDDIMLTLYFEMEAPTYEVEILEHRDQPGLYRLMNPYTQTVYPYGDDLAGMGATMASEGSYIEINAQDPSAVYINHQSLGCTINPSHGELGFCTYPVYLMDNGQIDFETAKAQGFFGKLQDGVISFPKFKGEDFTFQGLVSLNGTPAYYACQTTGVQIVLPEAVTAEMSSARAKSGLMNRSLSQSKQQKTINNTLHINPMVTKIVPRTFNK